jgi:hypothetical protein
MTVKLNWHHGSSPSDPDTDPALRRPQKSHEEPTELRGGVTGIVNESWPEVWFQSPPIVFCMVQFAHWMAPANVPNSLSERVPVIPEIVTREAFPMGRFVENLTVTIFSLNGYGVECFHVAPVMSGGVILSGGVIKELVS